MDDKILIENEEKKYQKIWQHIEYKFDSDECLKIWDIIGWLKRKPIKKILIFGCGEGYGVHWLQKEGFDVYGLDITDVFKFNELKSKFTKASIWNNNFKDNEFDCCIGIDVLEHINSNKIKKTLQEINRISKFFYFVIDCHPDTCGSLIGEKLHLSVNNPYVWLTAINKYLNIEYYSGNEIKLDVRGRKL